jgi:small redox-active disulfide protein 2
MLKIKVLGPGCSNCQKVEAHTREALAALDLQPEYEIIKVTDPMEISQYILSTPGLVINEKVVAAARIPNVAEIKSWLSEAIQAS